ncbi:hypothetical protein GCM10008119_33910 [Pedobacter mendelii]|uniref:Uncharacterized protein n=2 Tax=Pedobacter mendelii TaxID=1908240 RepID=A0ABQ2BNH2_9SPHI|nr:hypothetical protein GCM10008119_33910 [Pedobacter mendelii]
MPDGELMNFDTQYQLLFLDSLNIVKEVVTRNTLQNKIQGRADLQGDTALKTDTLYKYFLFKRFKKSGILIDSLRTKTSQIFSVDSLIKLKGWDRAETYNVDNLKLNEVVKNNHLGWTVSEKYSNPSKNLKDENEPDSVYLFFDRTLNNVPFSFSHKIDKDKKAKLSKIILVFNPKKTEGFDRTIPRREFSFEIVKVQLKDRRQVIDLFEILRGSKLK